MPAEVKAQSIYDAIHASAATGGFTIGGLSTTGGSTRLVADDILTLAGSAGQPISQFRISLADASGSATAFTVTANTGFWMNNGPGGGPGTLLFQSSFPVTLQPGGSGIFTQSVAVGSLIVPANGTFWAGISFQGTADVSGNVQANGMTVGLHDPPTTIGSTTRTFFETASAYFPATSSPSGDLSVGPGATQNFGWQFTAVPEPTTVGLLLAGAFIATRTARRRFRGRR